VLSSPAPIFVYERKDEWYDTTSSSINVLSWHGFVVVDVLLEAGGISLTTDHQRARMVLHILSSQSIIIVLSKEVSTNPTLAALDRLLSLLWVSLVSVDNAGQLFLVSVMQQVSAMPLYLNRRVSRKTTIMSSEGEEELGSRTEQVRCMQIELEWVQWQDKTPMQAARN